MDAASDWVVSNNNLALDFDGVNDHISLPNSNALSVFSNMRNTLLSCWANVRAIQTNVLCKVGYTSNVGNRNFDGWQIACWSDGVAYFGIRNTGIVDDDYFVTFNNYLLNTWTHFALLVEGDSVVGFVNGTQVGAPVNASAITSSSQTFTLGPLIGARWEISSGSPVVTRFANALIDDVRFYSHSANRSMVRQLASERGIGFKTSSRTSSVFAKRYAYKPPKDKTYAAITRSQSDYDSLREGLVLAICPSVSGATGYRAVDVSGRGNHGTLTNMTSDDWVVSGGAGALDFDNVDDQIAINSNIQSFTANSRSVSFFVKFNAVNANSYVVGNESDAGSGFGLGIYLRSTGVVRCYNYNANTGALDTFSTLSANVFYHYCMTFDGTTTRAYLNGLLDNSRTGDSGTSSLTNYLIGKWQQGNLFLNGQLDDLRFYSKVLTPPEIRQLASKRGIGLRSQKQTMFYQFPSGSKRRRLLTGMP
jgi:hypothetical protein